MPRDCDTKEETSSNRQNLHKSREGPGKEKKPINIKNFGGTPPGARPVCPGTRPICPVMCPVCPGDILSL